MAQAAAIEARLNTIAGTINVQYGALIDVILELRDGLDRWSGDGVWTMEQFIVWRAGVSPSTAAALVTVAGRAEDLPLCLQAFRDGQLSLDQISAIARRAPWWTDADSLGYGSQMTVPQLRRVMNQYPFPDLDEDGREVRPEPVTDDDLDAEPDDVDGTAQVVVEPIDDSSAQPAADADPEDDQNPATASGPLRTTDEGYYCSWSFDDDGSLRLHAHLDAESGDIVAKSLDEARDQLFLDGHAGVTDADALREVCERSLDSIESPSRRNRFKLAMFFETDGSMSDTSGRRVPDGLRQHVSCDGSVTPILLDNGLPVSVGRAQHIVPDRVRTLIERRDHGVCRVPGCTSRLGLEVHHIVHWEYDGPTDTWNLVLVCGRHHRSHHRGNLGISGNADELDGLLFTDSHGRIIRQSGAAPNPPGESPTPPSLPYKHPLDERLDLDSVLFTPPPAHLQELLDRAHGNGSSANEYLNSFRT